MSGRRQIASATIRIWFGLLFVAVAVVLCITSGRAAAAAPSGESVAGWSWTLDYGYDATATGTTPLANTRTDAPPARPDLHTRSGVVRLVSGFGRAAKAADDWPVLSGIVRDATKGKGNFGLGSGTASQATRAGESWVGDGYRIASDGKTLVSRDGLRTFRPPTWKPKEGKYQANFEYWNAERVGKPFGNGHLDITDMVP